MESNKIIFNIFLISCVVLFFSLSFGIFSAVSEFTMINSKNTTITFEGEGKVSIIPNIAQFSFTVSAKEFELEKARDIVTRDVERIYKYLKNNEDIEKKDIKTTRYDISPVYEYIQGLNRRSTRTFTGYRISHTTMIIIRELDRAGKILAEVSKGDIYDVSNIVFTNEEKELKESKNNALALAIKDAKSKAKNIAKQTNLKLGRIASVNIERKDQYYSQRGFSSVSLEDSSYKTSSVPLETGENEINEKVSLTYYIK